MHAHNNATSGALLSVDSYVIFQNFNFYSGILFSVFGTISNCINIRTFLAMGIKDGVIVSFLSLSIADLLTSLMTIFLCVSIVFHVEEITSDVVFFHDPRMLAIFAVDISFMTYVVTILTTLYIAVARCLCVARPLHFKNTFSRGRSITILASFYFIAVAAYIPLFANQGTESHFIPSLNRSRVEIWLSADREQIKDGLFLVTQTIVAFVTEFILIFCVIVMINTLRKASRFRRTMASNWKIKNPANYQIKHTAQKRETDKHKKIQSDFYELKGDNNNFVSENKDDKKVQESDCQVDSTSTRPTTTEIRANKDISINQLSSSVFYITTGVILSPNLRNKRRSSKTSKTNHNASHNITYARKSSDVPSHSSAKNNASHNIIYARKSSDALSHSSDSPNGSQDCGKEPIFGLCRRDVLVVHQVVLISIIFIVLNTPSMVNGVAGVLVPDYDADWEADQYARLYLATSFLRRVIEQINCSMNVFIYYRYNSKFRKFFWPHWLRRCTRER